MKKITFLFILSVFELAIYSPKIFSQTGIPVNVETARAVALKYCLQTDKKFAQTSEKDLILSLAETKSSGTEVLYYVFNINSDDGFIIISADTNTPPVLCYVPEGTYSKYPELRPPGFNEWLGTYSKQIEYSLQKTLKSRQSQDLWSAFLAKGPLDAETMVLKLTSRWAQTVNYNAYTPVTGGTHPPSDPGTYGGRTPTGCVATAMGQIIYYYQWPLNGTGSHSYDEAGNPNANSNCGSTDPSYGTLSFLNHTSTYNYSNMVDFPGEQNLEISRLLYNCGVSVDMDYAFCQSWTNTFLVENALRTYFDYNTSIAYIKRSDYSDNAWESILVDQIRRERVIQYRGNTSAVGHSWVCYGYQTVSGSKVFAFNWGWGGDYNGFFSITSSSPAYPFSIYNLENGAVINIYPSSQPNLTIPTASVNVTPVSTLVPFTLSFNVTNNGIRDAVSSTAKCYLSTDATLDNSDIYLTSFNVPSLTIGQNTDISNDIVIGDVLTGDYYILVEADTYHDVHESNEFDNINAIAIHVVQSPVGVGEYQSAASGNWSNLGTWQYYDGSVWVAATIIPTSAGGKITIRSPHIVTLTTDIPADEVNIMSGGQLTVAPATVLTIADGTEVIDFSVNGTIVNSGTITSVGKLAFNSGAVYEHAQNGGTIPIALWATNSNCNITGVTNLNPQIPSATQPFGNFTYNCPNQTENLISLYGQLNSIAGDFSVIATGPSSSQNDLRLGRISPGDLTVNGNFIQTGGYFLIEGEGDIDNTRIMTVGKDFTVSPNGTFIVSYYKGIGTLNVGGNFSSSGMIYVSADNIFNSVAGTINVSGNCTISGGIMNTSGMLWQTNPTTSAGNLNLAGNFTFTGGTITESSTGSGNIAFNGTGTQIFTNGGTLSGTINLTVNNGSILQMGTGAVPAIIGSGCSGSFTLSNGATLGITSPVGISSSGSTGNIRNTGARTFNTGANYIYDGSGGQLSGDGLPSTINSLLVSGSSNLSLTGSSLTVTNSLSINTGANLNIAASQKVTTKDFNNGGTLVINSSAVDNNGSFLATGALSQPGGSVTYNRQLLTGTNGNRHFFSSPVASNSVTNSLTVSQVWRWDETNGTWPVTSMTALNSGYGYNLSQTAGSNGLITFTGSAVNNISVTATSPYKNGYTPRNTSSDYGVGNEGADIWAPGRSWTNYGAGGWNLLGNPFASAMSASAFITANGDSFDPHYLALYIYDGTTDQYKYAAASIPGFPGGISSFGDNIQVGQGFFVLALYDNIGFNYTPAMQLHSTTAAMTKSGSIVDPWPGLQLKVKYGNKEGLTTIVYNQKMTAGLDPGYDIGQFSSGPDVEIYTSMVSGNNGVNLARQALPIDSCNKIIVPVGISSENGGMVTFSAYTVPFENYRYFLEDRKLGVFTDLNSDTYTVTLPEKTYGTGRFFIYSSADNLTGITKKTSDSGFLNVRVWLSDNNVIIDGAVSSMATAAVYDLQGHKLLETRLTSGSYNTFPMPLDAKGLYILKLTDGNKSVVKKIVAL